MILGLPELRSVVKGLVLWAPSKIMISRKNMCVLLCVFVTDFVTVRQTLFSMAVRKGGTRGNLISVLQNVMHASNA